MSLIIVRKKYLNKIASFAGGRKNTNDEKNLFRVH